MTKNRYENLEKRENDEQKKKNKENKPEAQSKSTKFAEKDGAVIRDNYLSKDKVNLNKTTESAEKI